jgi:hypothetical protein
MLSAPISPSEQRRDHGGYPLLETGQHMNATQVTVQPQVFILASDTISA